VINLIAVIVALAALIAALAAAAYLGLLGSAARKRGMAGGAVAADVRKRWPVVLATLGGAVLSLLMTLGGTGLDITGIVVAAVSGGAAAKSLTAVRSEYRSS
jgi:hypothetical protein